MKMMWEPKEDITAYELALCLAVFFDVLRGWEPERKYNLLPEEAKRHFRVVTSMAEEEGR